MFCCFILTGYSQQKLTKHQAKDSILKLFDYSLIGEDSVSVEILKNAKNLALKYSLDSLAVVSYCFLSDGLLYNKDTISFFNNLNNLLAYSKAKKNKSALAQYYKNKGVFFSQLHEQDSAYYYHHKAKETFVDANDFERASIMYIPLINIQSEAGDVLGVEETAVEALSFLEKTKHNDAIANVYMTLGLNTQKNNLEKALNYFDKALLHNEKVRDPNWKTINLIQTYIYISYSYTYHEKFNKSLEYSKKGIKIVNDSTLLNDKNKFLVTLYQNLGVSQIGLKKKKEGLKHLKFALSLCTERELHQKAEIYYDLAYYYFSEENSLLMGFDYANKALIKSKKIKFTQKELEIYSLLSEYSTGKTKINYLNQVVKLKDSLYKIEASEKDKFALVRFETKRKEEENKLLKQQNLSNNIQIQNTQQKNKIILLISAVVLLSVLFFIISYTLRQRSLTYKRNLEKAEVREEERKEISKILHDKIAGDLRVIYQKTLNNYIPEVSDSLFKVNQEIRNISHKLSTINFYDVSFKDQIINLVSDYFSPDFKIKVSGLNDIDWSLINTPIKRTLYLVARESIQNSKKHAIASELNIEFHTDKKKLSLKINDNGKGFDVDSPKYGLGLKSQKERVEELDGLFTLRSILNNGTTTIVNLPLTNI
ncbi:Histidine kinase-, DNA gyrase B-, and HSP90-like ATPase [Lutibacter sp. Hel_I_33_5]|nr:Histidine kinase-, DNA gyrase B-, and HSP90-like ATPase [Lutibacter sp. Hel_I_33_5]